MRLVLTLFGLVQLAVAIMVATLSDEIVDVLVTPAPVAAELALDGVVQSEGTVPNPGGEPFVFAHITVRGAEGADGLRPVLWAGSVGNPDITLLTREGESKVRLTGDPRGWREVPVESHLIDALHPELADRIPGWEAHAIDDEAFRVEVLALRKLDRVLVEMKPDGTIQRLWYGGSRIREESLTRVSKQFAETYDVFIWLTVVLTMTSGLFCIGGGFTRS